MKSAIHKINIYRRYRHWAKAKCIYIHVPKAAGTSINKAIYGRTLGHYRAEEIKHCFPDLFHKSYVFSIVRNPWSRALSAYQFARQGRTDSMGVNNPKQYQIPAFDSFESFLNEWLIQQNTLTLDFIFQPQSHFVCNNQDELITNYIGKVETLSDNINEISQTLQRDIIVPHANKTSNGQKYHDFYLNQDMINIIAKIYQKDIALFGYTFDE